MTANFFPVASVIIKNAYALLHSLFLIVVMKTIATSSLRRNRLISAHSLSSVLMGSVHSGMYLEARTESEAKEQHAYWIVTHDVLS